MRRQFAGQPGPFPAPKSEESAMTPVAVICTVLGYIAVLFVVAWLSGRRADNAGFFTGNRRR